MKKLILFLWLALASISIKAEMPAPPVGSVWIDINSSYWTLGSVGCYINAAQAMYWNTNQLQQWQDNRSGGSLLEAQQRLYKYGAAQAAHVGAGGNVYVEYWPDNNGGYSPSTWHTDYVKLIQAPGLMFDGTSYVNPSGTLSAQAGTWKYVIGGSIPVGPAAGSHYFTGSADQQLDAQAQTDGGATAFLSFGTFYYLDDYAGWTNDIVNGTHFREVSKSSGYDEEHPGTSGAFAMAVRALQQRIDTNVWTAVVDFSGAASVSTNHCAISSVTLISGTLSVTTRADRHSMAFDMPDPTTGKTNDSSNVFRLQPAYSNAFFEVIRLQNIPDGYYQVGLDASNIVVTTSDVLRGGFNWFPVTKGSIWNQRIDVLDWYRDRYGYDRITLIPSNGGTAFGEQTYQSNAQGFWNIGARDDVLISDLTTIWNTLHAVDVSIWAAATPVTHVMTFTYLGPLPPKLLDWSL